MRSTSVVNLCFHGIGAPGRGLEPGERAYWIEPALFEEILDDVTGRQGVRLSFDDGNASDLHFGLEALLRRGLTATFFVLAGRLDAPGSLSTHDVRVLHESGMRVGNHGMDHHPWRGLDGPELRRELVEARLQISEAVGAPVVEAALPLGRYGRRTLRALRRERYKRVYSSDRRPAKAEAWLQPRYSIRHDDTTDSVRRWLLREPSLQKQLRDEAVGVIKRLR